MHLHRHTSLNDFAARLGNIPEIVEYDIASVIVAKEETGPRWSPTSSRDAMSTMWRQVSDRPLRTRDGPNDVYLCSPACMNVYLGGAMPK